MRFEVDGSIVEGTIAEVDFSRDKVYEFAFVGTSLKLRGSDAALTRPIALRFFSAGNWAAVIGKLRFYH